MRSGHIGNFVHATERQYSFRRKCSKFAMEQEWNSANSQYVKYLGFLEKFIGILQKKLEIFVTIDKSGNFAVDCESNPIISDKCFFSALLIRVFGRKLEICESGNLEILENVRRKRFFENFFFNF